MRVIRALLLVLAISACAYADGNIPIDKDGNIPIDRTGGRAVATATEKPEITNAAASVALQLLQSLLILF